MSETIQKNISDTSLDYRDMSPQKTIQLRITDTLVGCSPQEHSIAPHMLEAYLATEYMATLKDLEEIQHYIITQFNSLLDRSKQVIEMVNSFKTYERCPKQIDSIATIFVRAITEYKQVADSTLKDIELYQASCYRALHAFQQETCPEVIAAHAQSAQNIQLVDVLRQIRTRVKNDRKQLIVVFSRFDYGYGRHLAHCNRLEAELIASSKRHESGISGHAHEHEHAHSM